MPGTGPALGLACQVAVLAALAGTVGLGPAGLGAGGSAGLLLYVLLARGLAGAPLGPADRVTLTRATLAGGVAALAADSFTRPAPVPVLVTLATVALALDWADGRVARRTGTASALGARFDMEVDAFLLLVLSAYVAPAAGVWVLAIGGMRYAYVAAARLLPWLGGPLPPRQWRKVVAAIQGVVLVVAAADVLPRPLTTAALAAALALLAESFGREILWRWHHGLHGYVPLAPRRGEEAIRGTVRGGPVRRG